MCVVGANDEALQLLRSPDFHLATCVNVVGVTTLDRRIVGYPARFAANTIDAPLDVNVIANQYLGVRIAVETCASCVQSSVACDFGRFCADCERLADINLAASACGACRLRGCDIASSLVRACSMCLANGRHCFRIGVLFCTFDADKSTKNCLSHWNQNHPNFCFNTIQNIWPPESKTRRSTIG